jgi:hypothetical protein
MRLFSVGVGFPLVLVGLLLASSGCSDPTAPSGNGNDVVDDTRPQPRPPATPDQGDMDASADGSIYVDAGPEAAPVELNACSSCTCSPDQYFCFAGATARASIHPEPFSAFSAFAGSDAAGASEGGAAACPVVGGATPAVGCNAMPSGCSDCTCIITQLQPKYGCYLVCANRGDQLLVYCPNP